MPSRGLPPGAGAPPSEAAMALSSSAEAFHYASQPSPATPNFGEQSKWDDSDEDTRSPGPGQRSRWSDISQRASRTSSLRPDSYQQQHSKSQFSDEDNSDEERYGRPDGAQRSSGYTSDPASASGSSNYVTAPNSADLHDLSGFLDDRSERYYRQSALEQEAYRHLSLARRPSPRPEDLSLPPASERKFTGTHLSVAGNGLTSPTLLPPPASPTPSTTSSIMPLNIKKKVTSPASPNFAASQTPLPTTDSTDTPPLSSRFELPSAFSSVSSHSDHARQSSSSQTSNSTGVFRTSTLSQTFSSSARTSHGAVRQASSHSDSPKFSPLQAHPPPPPNAEEPPDSESEYEDDEGAVGGGGGGKSDSDDNVPLATRIPTALKAQQSIRAKDDEERQKRREARSARKGVDKPAPTEMPRSTGPTSTQSTRASTTAKPDRDRVSDAQPKSPKSSSPLQIAGSHSSFANDLSDRLAQVQYNDEEAVGGGGGEQEAQYGVALALDNTGRVAQRTPPPTNKSFPRTPPPPDAFRSHAELQVKRQSSQPHMGHGGLSRRTSTSSNFVGLRDMRPPSPGSSGVDPDARMRAYAQSAGVSRSTSTAKQPHYTTTSRSEFSSRPGSPMRIPPHKSTTMPPRIPAATTSRPQSPTTSQFVMPPKPNTGIPRRPMTADRDARPMMAERDGRPMTADRDGARPMFGPSTSRPESPVMRPPSPSMSKLTPDERLRQAAMARGTTRGRTMSVSGTRPGMPNFDDQQAPRRPSESSGMRDLTDRPANVVSPSEMDQVSRSAPRTSPQQSTTPLIQQRVLEPMMPPPPASMDSSLTPDERLRQIAMARQHSQSNVPLQVVSMDEALTPDERLRQIAMSRAQPAAANNTTPYRKRAMSLGKPTKEDSSGVHQRSKTLVRQGARSVAPMPAPPLPMPVLGGNQRPCVVHSATGGQKVVVVDVGPHTRAKEVIAQVQAQGQLTPGVQGWLLYEVCHDLNLERPVREFEIPSECCARWTAEGNTFAIRPSRLASSLAQSAIPTTSPAHGSYVEFEVKRGKWSKRWLELRENNLWVSKRDNGKDAVLVCSLSNFDVFTAVRPTLKSPRYAFTLRSTDDLSMFENPADSLHCFCALDARDGERWVENIMVARSCVLSQERVALFRSPQPQHQQHVPNGHAHVHTHGQPPQQLPRRQPTVTPLVNVRALAHAAGIMSPASAMTSPRNNNMMGAPSGPGGNTGPFEPGSLLARAAAAERT